jgi:hypothetical protein
MSTELTDDAVRTVLGLVSTALDDPGASDEVTELDPEGNTRLFGVQPSEKSRASFVVRVSREA